MAARHRVRDTQIEKDYVLTWPPFEAVFREAKRHFKLV
jgi:hypothetical protein